MLLPMPELKRPTYDRLVVNTAKYVSQKVLLTFWDMAYIEKKPDFVMYAVAFPTMKSID